MAYHSEEEVTFITANLSPAALRNRERDLARMRERFKRQKKTVLRKNGQKEFLELKDLARAIRYAKRLANNEGLITHLELAATYFDDAAKGYE